MGMGRIIENGVDWSKSFPHTSNLNVKKTVALLAT